MSPQESDPQLFTNDANFWQDVSTFICSSPQNSFDYPSEDFAYSAASPTSPSEQNFKAIEPENGTTQPRVRGQTLELLLVIFTPGHFTSSPFPSNTNSPM